MQCLPDPLIYRWTIPQTELAAIGDDPSTWATYQIEKIEGRVHQVDVATDERQVDPTADSLYLFASSSREIGQLGPHLLWLHRPECLTLLPTWYRPGPPLDVGLRASCLLDHPALAIRTLAFWTNYNTTDLPLVVRVWITPTP